MSHPLKSNILAADGLLAAKSERAERALYEEILAEDIRADELATIFYPFEKSSSAVDPPDAGVKVEDQFGAFETLSDLARQRKPLCGGIYTGQEALALLNSHYFIGKSNQDTAIYRVNDDGSATFVPPEQFKLEVQNIFVKPSGTSSKSIPAEKFWKESAHRQVRKIVFKPGGAVGSHEFNLWRGFGVEAKPGWQKQRSLVRHIREVICRRDKKKFHYLMRWLAWTVQNPDKHAGVVILLKSRKQGTGKTTLSKVMLDIFGQHGALVDDKERLLGRFTDWLETKSFVAAEEMLFAGDHKAADKFKSLVTGDNIQVERKFGSCRQIPNRLKIIATTNHEHAVAAGVRDRRNVVYDVSDEHAGDKAWFDSLYHDLADGGTNEFLHLLQGLRLGDWHPRDILKTPETTEQQRMSGDSISQWSQACIDADAVIGGKPGAHGVDTAQPLNAVIPVPALHKAYCDFCGQSRLHAVSVVAFGKACAEMFGPRTRLSSNSGSGNGNRPWGYSVPNGNTWQGKLDARLGI